MKLTEAEKQERIKLLSDGHSLKKIAQKLYLSELSVKNWFYRNGIKVQTSKCEASQRCQKMRQELPTLEAFEQAAGDGTGAVYDRIAAKYSVARSVAYDHWRELRRCKDAH